MSPKLGSLREEQLHAAQKPSIVFLDELDRLVPARGASANPGTQIYASVVSTLLALLDGISDRKVYKIAHVMHPNSVPDKGIPGPQVAQRQSP